jgi:hypothetical protein
MSERVQAEAIRSMAEIARRLVHDADTAERRAVLLKSVSKMSPVMAHAVMAELNRRAREASPGRHDYFRGRGKRDA